MTALRRAMALGFAGTVALAAGGRVSGALPVRDRIGLPQSESALGLLVSYFGIGLLVAAWWGLGRQLRGPEPPTIRRLLATFGVWAAPLLAAPPLFSRDVYSYLAQGAMVSSGIDAYTYGPAALGGPLAAEVPAMWRNTPAPYGPLFLALARVTAHGGIAGMRLMALLGVGLLVVFLPLIARRCGVDPAAALWLGALNPLVLLHLVAGAHNDAIMLGLLGAGLVMALPRAAGSAGDTAATGPGPEPIRSWRGMAAALRRASGLAAGWLPPARPPTALSSAGVAPRSLLLAAGSRRLPGWARLAGAAAVVTLAALVKAPAALGLLVVASLWADRLTGRARWARAAATTAGASLATTVLVTAATGTGYGWIEALSTPASASNWSLTNTLGRLTDPLLTTATWHRLGLAAAATAILVVWLLRRRLGPVYALGLSLVALALLGPALRPWYLLWGLIPIAAAAPNGRARRLAAVGSGLLALAVLPDGFPASTEQLALATAGGTLAALTLYGLRLIRTRTAAA